MSGGLIAMTLPRNHGEGNTRDPVAHLAKQGVGAPEIMTRTGLRLSVVEAHLFSMAEGSRTPLGSAARIVRRLEEGVEDTGQFHAAQYIRIALRAEELHRIAQRRRKAKTIIKKFDAQNPRQAAITRARLQDRRQSPLVSRQVPVLCPEMGRRELLS